MRKRDKFRTIESLPPSCSDEDKYIQKNTSIQGIFRVFFYCRHAKGVIKWFLVSKMVGPFYTVSPQVCGVYGLFILLGGLCTKVISLSDVEVTGNLLLDLMPVMFIPAAVGIIDKIEELKATMIPMLIITFVTTFIVMTITGKTAEWIIKRQKKREK